MDPKNKSKIYNFYKAMQFLEDSCIRSLGLLDEWALPFMQNALRVAEATINIATVPFVP